MVQMGFGFENNKGQYLTLEQFVVFVIGIVITLTIFFTFTSIKDKLQKSSEKDQLKEVGQFVVSNIVTLSNYKNTSAALKLNIPKKISNKNYKLEIKSNRLKISFPDRKKEVEVYLEGLNESKNLFGTVYSSKGKIKITKRENNIILGRVQ